MLREEIDLYCYESIEGKICYECFKLVIKILKKNNERINKHKRKKIAIHNFLKYSKNFFENT